MQTGVRLHKQVKGFTLEVQWETGDGLTALFGFSGSGKTMTLKMIAGLMKPDAGAIQVSGRKYYDSASGVDIKPRERRTGYVLQDYALFPHMSVRQNIGYGLTGLNRPGRAGRVDEMIDLFRLGGIAAARPREISGGQQQRVALARALIGRPELLMLDEPFSALDQPIRGKMQDIIREVRSEFSIPVILVTHDFSEVRKLADKVIVYANGRIVQQGSPGEIEESPASSQVNELLGIR